MHQHSFISFLGQQAYIPYQSQDSYSKFKLKQHNELDVFIQLDELNNCYFQCGKFENNIFQLIFKEKILNIQLDFYSFSKECEYFFYIQNNKLHRIEIKTQENIVVQTLGYKIISLQCSKINNNLYLQYRDFVRQIQVFEIRTCNTNTIIQQIYYNIFVLTCVLMKNNDNKIQDNFIANSYADTIQKNKSMIYKISGQKMKRQYYIQDNIFDHSTIKIQNHILFMQKMNNLEDKKKDCNYKCFNLFSLFNNRKLIRALYIEKEYYIENDRRNRIKLIMKNNQVFVKVKGNQEYQGCFIGLYHVNKGYCNRNYKTIDTFTNIRKAYQYQYIDYNEGIFEQNPIQIQTQLSNATKISLKNEEAENEKWTELMKRIKNI